MACSDNLYEDAKRTASVKEKGSTSSGIAEAEASAPCVLPQAPFEEDRAITRGLMKISEKTLASIYENEPDIYTEKDLKVRFR